MFGFSTNDVAKLAGVKPETIRHTLSKYGHYLGISPVKGGNGRLIWPRDQVAVIFGEHSPETGLEVIATLADKLAYCTTNSHRHSMNRNKVRAAYSRALDAFLGAGQSLGAVSMTVDAGQVWTLLLGGSSHAQ